MNETEPTGKERGAYYQRVLDKLFSNAKVIDEWNYVQSLLHVRGGEELLSRSPMFETIAAFDETLNLVKTPVVKQSGNATGIRLSLLLYCHVVEAKYVYEVIANFLRVANGEGYTTDPIQHLYKVPKLPAKNGGPLQAIPPSAKRVIGELQKLARVARQPDIAAILGEMFDENVRNAFSHSDYIIKGHEFQSPNCWFRKGQIWSQVMHLQDLVDLINRGLAFFQAFVFTVNQHRLAYKGPKQLSAPVGQAGESGLVELIANDTQGLHGFRFM